MTALLITILVPSIFLLAEQHYFGFQTTKQ